MGRNKLDQNPFALFDLHRLQQVYLADAELRRDVQPPIKPDAATVARYIASHPAIFGEHPLLKVDQLRFPFSGGDAGGLAFLNSAQTLEEVQTILGSRALQRT